MCSNGELVTQLSKMGPTRLNLLLESLSPNNMARVDGWKHHKTTSKAQPQASWTDLVSAMPWPHAGKVLSQETSQTFSTPKRLAFTSCWETLSELCKATQERKILWAAKKKLWKLIEIFEIEGKPTSTPTCPHCHIETHMNPMLSTETCGSFALGSLIEKKSNAHQASAKIKLAHLSHSNLNYQTTQDISLQISMSMVICYLSHAKCWGVRSSLWVKSPLLLMDVPFFLNRAGMGLAPELLGCPNLSA